MDKLTLKENLRNILVDEFSKEMDFDINTGRVYNKMKRFSGMPFVGDNYISAPLKILIVGSDIGNDECVDNDTYHTFETKHKHCILEKYNYGAHLAGTYITALYLLRNTDDFKDSWDKIDTNNTAYQGIKRLISDIKHRERVDRLIHSIALTNLHKFVTINRKDRSGNTDRIWIKEETELNFFLKEVECFNPDIVILQEIGDIPEEIISSIRSSGRKVYKLTHPSTRKRGGRIVKTLIIEPIENQDAK